MSNCPEEIVTICQLDVGHAGPHRSVFGRLLDEAYSEVERLGQVIRDGAHDTELQKKFQELQQEFDSFTSIEEKLSSSLEMMKMARRNERGNAIDFLEVNGHLELAAALRKVYEADPIK